MGKLLVPGELWERIEPLRPKTEPKPRGGRPRTPDRIALTGILFVLKTGIPWEDLPQELGCSGMTCWRRLRDWQQTGVWARLHWDLLDELGRADKINWERTALDATLVPAKRGSRDWPEPHGRGRPGTKYHLLVDQNGIPLVAEMTPANVHDSKMFTAMLDAAPPTRALAADCVGDPKNCIPTRATTIRPCAWPAICVTSCPASLARVSRRRRSSGVTAGSSSGRSHGCAASGA